MDGADIGDENYDKAPGSLILTIKAAYLDTLSTGSHNIEITFADGTATASITIAKAPSNTTPAPVPKTGENDSPLIFIGITLLIAGALGMLIAVKLSRAPRRKVMPAPHVSGQITKEDN